MSIKTELSCPLGHTCEKIEDGVIKRCMWYRPYKIKDPQDPENVIDHWDCQMNWQTAFMLDVGRQTQGVQKATEQTRNKVHEGNAIGAKMLNMVAEGRVENTKVMISPRSMYVDFDEQKMLEDKKE